MSASKRVVATYLVVSGLFTLGASLIWAINTIFLIREGGLTLFQTMVVNAIFTVAQMAFEIPTGVVADTIGRRASIVLSMVILAVSTLLYVLSPSMGWGFLGFSVASVLLGLGYTFQTGSVEAWVVDALDSVGWPAERERTFAWGQISSGIGTLAGALLGGLLGQADLALPYLARVAVLAVCFVLSLVFVHDLGFTPRPLRWSTFGTETRKIFSAGVTYGWRSRVVRPMMWASALSGLFFFYGFYAWQPYVLELLGRDLVWLLGVVQAASSAAGIAGNALVGRVMGNSGQRRDPARVLGWLTLTSALVVAAIAAVGFIWREPGVVPAGVAIVLWLLWGVIFGITMPVRMGYLNAHIPSAQRATVISLDAFFADGGAAAGQPVLGWVSDRASIPVAWLLGSVAVGVSALFYRQSGRAAGESADAPAEPLA